MSRGRSGWVRSERHFTACFCMWRGQIEEVVRRHLTPGGLHNRRHHYGIWSLMPLGIPFDGTRMGASDSTCELGVG